MIRHERNIKQIAVHSNERSWNGEPVEVRLNEVRKDGEDRLCKMLSCTCKTFSDYKPCRHVRAAYVMMRFEHSQKPEDKLRNVMEVIFDDNPSQDILVPLGIGQLVIRLRPRGNPAGSPLIGFTIILESHTLAHLPVPSTFEVDLYEEYTRDDFFINLLRGVADALEVEASLGSTEPDNKPGRACAADTHVEMPLPLTHEVWGTMPLTEIANLITLATRGICLNCYNNLALEEELLPY